MFPPGNNQENYSRLKPAGLLEGRLAVNLFRAAPRDKYYLKDFPIKNVNDFHSNWQSFTVGCHWWGWRVGR